MRSRALQLTGWSDRSAERVSVVNLGRVCTHSSALLASGSSTSQGPDLLASSTTRLVGSNAQTLFFQTRLCHAAQGSQGTRALPSRTRWCLCAPGLALTSASEVTVTECEGNLAATHHLVHQQGQAGVPVVSPRSTCIPPEDARSVGGHPLHRGGSFLDPEYTQSCAPPLEPPNKLSRSHYDIIAPCLLCARNRLSPCGPCDLSHLCHSPGFLTVLTRPQPQYPPPAPHHPSLPPTHYAARQYGPAPSQYLPLNRDTDSSRAGASQRQSSLPCTSWRFTSTQSTREQARVHTGTPMVWGG